MITVTVTGNLTDDPRTFTVRDGMPGCELRLAVDMPPRGESSSAVTRYLKVTAFGVLASHAADSLRKGDRVTVQGHDLIAEAWTGTDGEARGKTCIRATEIAASLRFDNLTTGRAIRRAAKEAAAATDADAQVLAGVS